MASIIRVSTMGKSLIKFVVAASLVLAGLPPALAQMVIPPGGAVTVPAGGLNLGCTSLDVQGNLTLGTSHIDQSGSVNIASTGTVDAGQGTIVVGGDWTNSGTFIAGTSTVTFSDACGSGGGHLSGNTTFTNLTFTSTTGKAFVVPAGSHIVVTGTLVVQGTPANPLHLNSSSGALAYIVLAPGATVSYINAQVAPNVVIGSAASMFGVPTLSTYASLLLGLLLAVVTATGGWLRPAKNQETKS
jgi:hypothetical protein